MGFILKSITCFSQRSKHLLSFQLSMEMLMCMRNSSLAALCSRNYSYIMVMMAIPRIGGMTSFFLQSQCLSPSFKRLIISYDFPGCRRSPAYELFHTPSLVYIEFASYVADSYEVDFGSLVEARLDLDMDEGGIDENSDCGEDDNTEDDNNDACGEDDEDVNTEDGYYSGHGEKEDDNVFGEVHDTEDDNDNDSDGDAYKISGDVTELVAGISNVKTLHLSSHSLEVFYFCCKSMPVFHNLLTLTFTSDKERGWQVLPLLLNNSPNLETLVIQGLVHQVTVKCGDACVCISNTKMMEEEEECCLSTCQVKVLHISGYGGTYRELMQMRHFLGNLKCLQTLKMKLSRLVL